MLLNRRLFLACLAQTLVGRAGPASTALAADGRTVGILIGIANDTETQARVKAFEQGLENEGWIIGQNLRLHYRYADGDAVGMQRLAKELVALRPDCILGHSTPVVTALMKATRSIPVVFVSVSDPIASGFVASKARPGGNLTGFTVSQPTITGKYLSILREMQPRFSRVAIMYNPQSVPTAGPYFLRSFLETAAEFKLRPIIAEVNSSAGIESALADLGSEPGSSLITVPDNFLTARRHLIISLAAKFR